MLGIEEKWRLLNWLLFGVSAGTLLMQRGNVWVQLAVITGQFSMHSLLWTAVRVRDARDSRLRQEKSRLRRESNSTPNLNSLYGGVPGFNSECDDA